MTGFSCPDRAAAAASDDDDDRYGCCWKMFGYTLEVADANGVAGTAVDTRPDRLCLAVVVILLLEG